MMFVCVCVYACVCVCVDMGTETEPTGFCFIPLLFSGGVFGYECKESLRFCFVVRS